MTDLLFVDNFNTIKPDVLRLCKSVIAKNLNNYIYSEKDVKYTIENITHKILELLNQSFPELKMNLNIILYKKGVSNLHFYDSFIGDANKDGYITIKWENSNIIVITNVFVMFPYH